MTEIFEPVFEVITPGEQTVPFVLNIPHAGRKYPDWFLAQSRLDPLTLRRSEDCFVDELFADGVAMGAPLLKALFPRAYLDVNREPYELDPKMFDGRLPAFANTRSMRVAGGLGSIPRIVGDGQDIYREKLSVAEAIHRIETAYRPYHRRLRELLQATHARFDTACLLDCHSMPSASLGADNQARPDIVLGDRFGTSCAPWLMEMVETAFKDLGYNVTRNRPYAGGFVTEHYGNPVGGVHALQIEINRALYLDEVTLETAPGFAGLRHAIVQVLMQTFKADIFANPRQQAAE